MECFCGCGREVRKPLIPINLLGADFAHEFVETLQLKEDLERGEISTESFEPLLDDGRTYATQLKAVVHDEEPIGHLDARNTKRWIKFAKKSRKKINRRLNQLT